nr:MAG TPA: hypothetical protein [Caudoviricetes sp.]
MIFSAIDNGITSVYNTQCILKVGNSQHFNQNNLQIVLDNLL